MAERIFDPMTAQSARNADEALELARAWADGRRTWWNQILEFEDRGDRGPAAGVRQQSFVAVTQADAAEVAKWAALARAFRDRDATMGKEEGV